MKRTSIVTKIRTVSSSRQRGAIIRKVAKKLGLVYFGSLSHKDDHDVIRGITVSTSHKDGHYTIGSFDGYDISLIDRDDTYLDNGKVRHRRWTIIQVTLKRLNGVVEALLLPHDNAHRYDASYAAQRHIQSIEQLVSNHYSAEFLNRYQLLAPSHQSADINAVLTPALADITALKLWPHAVELRHQKLLIYITEDRLNETVLRVAIESALWLADSLDQRA